GGRYQFDPLRSQGLKRNRRPFSARQRRTLPRRVVVMCRSMAATPLTFLVHERGFDPRRVTTSDDVVKIGRGARLQLELQNPAASRMHAVLEVTEKGATLIDLGCEPSTRVNGV